jgi:hypothetical protein
VGQKGDALVNRQEQGMNTPKPNEPTGDTYPKKPMDQDQYKQPTGGTGGSGGSWGTDKPGTEQPYGTDKPQQGGQQPGTDPKEPQSR